MRPLNILNKNSNQKLKILFKEKLNNKFQFISILKDKKKNSGNLINSNSINKNNYNFNKRNNITINNSINHIVNNITINNNSINQTKNYSIKHNNSLSKPKESTSTIQNYQSYVDKKKYNLGIYLKKPTDLSRNAHNSFTNNINKSFYYLSLNQKIKKNPSFQKKTHNLKNKAMNYKLKLFLKIPNNNNLNLQNISNNICSRSKTNNNSIYNFTNGSMNENVKKSKNNSKYSTTNHSTNFTKQSFYKKKRSFQKKDNKNKKITINANPSNYNINYNKQNISKNISKNNSNINDKLYNNYILNNMLQKKTKSKNISINLKKFITRGNSKTISNNINNPNNNYSNTNSNIQISRYVNNFLNKSKYLNKNIKELNSKNRIYNSNYDLDEIEKKNSYINTNECEQEEQIKYVKEDSKSKAKEKDTSLEETLKFSKCSSKVEEEGELGLDEVKDIIIYYNLNNVKNKNYIFQKNDYINFVEKRKNKYLNFFLK